MNFSQRVDYTLWGMLETLDPYPRYTQYSLDPDRDYLGRRLLHIYDNNLLNWIVLQNPREFELYTGWYDSEIAQRIPWMSAGISDRLYTMLILKFTG